MWEEKYNKSKARVETCATNYLIQSEAAARWHEAELAKWRATPGCEVFQDSVIVTCICDTDPANPCPQHGTTYKGMSSEDILPKEF